MGYTTDDLIACARHRIYDMRAKAARELTETEAVGTHVLFIVHLPVQTMQSSLVGFQGEPWISAHIDEIRPTNEGNITLDIAHGVSISKLFYGPLADETLTEFIETRQIVQPKMEIASGAPTKQVISLVSQGPSTQVCPPLAGPNEQVLSQTVGPVKQLLPPVSGPTHQVVSVASGPTHQVVSMASGPTHQVVSMASGPTHQVVSMVPGPTHQVVSMASGPTHQVVSMVPGPTHHVVSMASGPYTHVISSVPQATLKISRKIVVPAMYTQCRRLHICIQAAASRLIQFTPNKRWATKRIELLTKLIPGHPQFPIGK